MTTTETCLACGLLGQPCIECKQHDWALPSTPPVENSNPEGGPKGADGQGVCTIKRGTLVIRKGDEYRVRSKVGRVVELETLSGSFAFTTLASLCQVSA